MSTFDDIVDQLSSMSPEELLAIAPFIDMFSGLGYFESTNYPPRLAIDPLFAPSGWKPEDGPYQYTGPGMVDVDGKIMVLRDQDGQPILDPVNQKPEVIVYDPRASAAQEYFAMQQDPERQDELDYTLMLLESKGYKTGTLSDNLATFTKIFQTAKDTGVSFAQVIQNIQMYQPDAETTDDQAGFRVTQLSSPADISTIANNTAQQAIGRKLTATEQQAFVQAFQNTQRGYYAQVNDPNAMEITQAPSVDVAAQNFISQQAPKEQVAYDALTNVGWLINGLRGVV